MGVWTHAVLGQTVAALLSFVGLAAAIEVNPTPIQIQLALDRGKQAAAQQRSPETLYARFGNTDPAQPEGFLLTKLGGLSVLAAHMALRGLEPSAADVAHVIEASSMLVGATIVGERPDFAVNSYLVLDQGGRTIKPLTVRADGQAERRATWPEAQKFHAKIVATFRYNDFDPHARTTITIFPAGGGEVHLPLNFKDIE
ncbi:MAG: hypothetical protein A4C66_10400 [Nitrospira sp. HN-bin3]|uniref:hypothetical protein n=1 Tax=Nitrospira cf. moscoviensis SBR1015 TaxID=96242 RepID=UPI000A0D0F2F|nr:hypothetical protein [Nitrospira cf. moscoviensis SBR1015]OQW40980.1 MAG: hypothetical protein A4C66_10400 [Nitrospira sp. HN-bin3]